MEDLSNIISIGGYIAAVGGAYMIIKSKVKNENIKDLINRVAILEKERAIAQEQHLENQKAIANLEGQLATYKEIPLKSIAGSLEQLTESNKSILETLKGSAKIIKKEQAEGGLLVQIKKKNPLEVKEAK